MSIYIGTAAWTIPQHLSSAFEGDGTHLERYSRRFNAVEINTSFYRDHKPATYARWAESVPETFRFAVKLSRHFTQETKLQETGPRLDEVLTGIQELGEKLGVLLIQLPPSLAFGEAAFSRFIEAVRKTYAGKIAIEPRHSSWTTTSAVSAMQAFGLSKVEADPERCALTSEEMARVEPFLYLRLHGSPEIYKSKYSAEAVERAASRMSAAAASGRQAWCIFDNTTVGYATEDAIAAQAAIGGFAD